MLVVKTSTPAQDFLDLFRVPDLDRLGMFYRLLPATEPPLADQPVAVACGKDNISSFKSPYLGVLRISFWRIRSPAIGELQGSLLKLWKWNAVAVPARYQRDSKYNHHVQSFWCAPNQTHDNSRQYHKCVLTKTLSTDLMLLRSRPRQTWCLFYSAKIDWRIETLKHGKVVEKSTSFQSLKTEALSQTFRCCLEREHRNEKASDKRKKKTPLNSCRDILIYGPHQNRWNVSRCFLASLHGCQQLVPSNYQI